MRESYLLGDTPGDSAAAATPVKKHDAFSTAFVFVPSIVAFVAIDVSWISLVAGSMYREVLGDMMRTMPSLVSGVLSWVCIVSMLQAFALEGSTTLRHAAMRGALLGLLLYGTFTLTNHSVIKTWTWALVAQDAGWGSLLCGIVTAFQYWLAQRCSRMRR